MTIFLIILFILIILSVLLFRAMLNGFKNPERNHDRSPADLGFNFTEIEIPAKNNRKLYGWLIPGRINAPLIILVHGWGRNAGRMLPYIEKLHPQGFNLLAFDSRNHGSSDKEQFSSMLKFAEDIISSIDFAERKIKFSAIGLLGLSIGGSASIYAAANDQRIKSVLTVGAFANPEAVIKKQLTDKHVPYYPFIWLLFIYLQKIIGKKFDEIAPEKNIAKSKAQFFLIHGKNDLTVPVEQAEKILKASNNQQSKLWIIPGKGHSNCHIEKDYWENIIDFFDKTLNLETPHSMHNQQEVQAGN